jgi:hypothetical protein
LHCLLLRNAAAPFRGSCKDITSGGCSIVPLDGTGRVVRVWSLSRGLSFKSMAPALLNPDAVAEFGPRKDRAAELYF